MRVCIITILFCLLSAVPSCLAIEKGYKPAIDLKLYKEAEKRWKKNPDAPKTFEMNPEFLEVFSLQREADRDVRVNGLDKIDIGVCEERTISAAAPNADGTESQKFQVSASFTRTQLKRFFANEKHKDLLFVTTGPGWFPNGKNYKEDLEVLKKYFEDVGYKRIVITEGGAFGTEVIYDSAETERKPI